MKTLFQELQREITLKELTPRPVFLYDSHILSLSTLTQNMKRFLKSFSKISSRNKNIMD